MENETVQLVINLSTQIRASDCNNGFSAGERISIAVSKRPISYPTSPTICLHNPPLENETVQLVIATMENKTVHLVINLSTQIPASDCNKRISTVRQISTV
ncbi:hypothetical protein Fot_06518 [Forsythia ovata]|uniref:MSP domain-containing protein n=1 Tax=Forsythia ovata TaxID=205694 RepID=A0ABD1WT59_9LAMI